MAAGDGFYGRVDPGPLGRAVAALDAAVTGLAEAPRLSAAPAEVGDALVALTRLQARLTAVQLALLGDADRAEVGSEVGAASAAVWWAERTRTTRPAAKAASRLATAVDPDTGTCRLVGGALAEGRLVEEQARVIVAAVAALPVDLDPTVRVKAEEVLVDLAAHHDARELRRLGRAVLEQVAPDLAEEHERNRLDAEERRAWEQVRFAMYLDGHGLAHGEFTLPEAQGEMLRQLVLAFAQARYRRGTAGPTGPTPERETTESTVGPTAEPTEPHSGEWADWAAWAGLGDSGAHPPGWAERPGSPGPPDPPTPTERGWWDKPPPQRMGEAFADLVERLDPDRLPAHGGVNPTVVVTMTLDQLTGHGGTSAGPATLDTGTPITAGQARRLACEAGIIPTVLGGASVDLDVGRRRRYFTPAQRLALAKRDRGCTAVGCDVPPAMCHAHHDRPWSHHGATDLVNGRLLCGRHHRLVHDPAYDHDIRPDNRVAFNRRA